MKTRTLLLTTILGTGLTLGLPAPSHASGYDTRDAVHDTRGGVVRNTYGNCVRTRGDSGDDECDNHVHTARAGSYPIDDEGRTVYFEFNKTNLKASANRKLEGLTNELMSMNGIKGVTIVGYADRIGDSDDNDRLSRKRAEVVENYMHKHGYLDTTIAKTRWLGESSPTTDCSSTLKRSALINCLENDRRVTVEIEYNDDSSNSASN